MGGWWVGGGGGGRRALKHNKSPFFFFPSRFHFFWSIYKQNSSDPPPKKKTTKKTTKKTPLRLSVRLVGRADLQRPVGSNLCYFHNASETFFFFPPSFFFFFGNELMTNALIHTPRDSLSTAAWIFTRIVNCKSREVRDTLSCLVWHWRCTTLGFAPLCLQGPNTQLQVIMPFFFSFFFFFFTLSPECLAHPSDPYQ